MANLPTTGLTLHGKTTNINSMSKTFGAHDVPSNGDGVGGWEPEADSIASVAWKSFGNATYLSSTPLMAHPDLDFNGSSSVYQLYTSNGASPKITSDVITNSAWTFAISFYPDTISSTAAFPGDNSPLIVGAGGGRWGIALKDVSGTKTLLAFVSDGTLSPAITATISTGHTWIAIYRFDAINLMLTVIDDTGAETNPTPVSAGTLGITAMNDALNMGARIAFYDGKIAEYAIYNVNVTGGSLTQLKNYFKQAWLGINPGGGKSGNKGHKGGPGVNVTDTGGTTIINIGNAGVSIEAN